MNMEKARGIMPDDTPGLGREGRRCSELEDLPVRSMSLQCHAALVFARLISLHIGSQKDQSSGFNAISIPLTS